ncbi:MAG: hypothetical protein CEE38_04520 [Planctomycetes bacterium B3_Pla]|nr:MAG: hypothetical protein CEE38_04520 [Planctomycetes bacterium B3_Pla]
MKKWSTLAVTALAFLTTTATVFACVPTDGLVAYYPFNGNANDESGNGHDGTVYGATLTTDRFGVPCSAYSFDGIDDYISVDYMAAFQLPVFTVSAWVRPAVDVSDPTSTSVISVVTRGEDFATDRASFLLIVAPSTSTLANGVTVLYEDYYDREQYYDTNIYPQVGQWTHLVASRDADGVLSIYSDGFLIGQWLTTPDPASNSYQDLLIGAYWFVPTPATAYIANFFSGAIDDVLIYNRALSPGDITGPAIVPVDIDPDPLYMDSKGQWITCYIEPPEGCNVSEIDVDSVLMEGLLEVQHSFVEGDVLMVKFDRQDLIAYIEVVLGIAPPDDVTLMVTGRLADGLLFEGTDVIGILDEE